MPAFDFVTSHDFRQSLERDYLDVQNTFGIGAWKSVQVLVGSIVEALLIDYLIATNNPSRSKKDLLKMDLADAITICQSEGVISQRTGDLCSVIRSYRNLIHPGRTIRLNEEPPSEGSARVAVALIDLIVADIERFRQTKFGSTASQIIVKVESDPECLPILRHLLEEMQQSERDKLVLEVLPKRYLELASGSSEDYEAFRAMGTLRKAYATAKALASDSAHRQAAANYVKVLKEGDSELVGRYDEAFFKAADLEYVASAHQALVKKHLLTSTGLIDNSDKLARLRGIEKYLKREEVTDWLSQVVRVLISEKTSPALKSETSSYLLGAYWDTPGDVDEEITRLLEGWGKSFRSQGREADAVEVEKLHHDYGLPF